MKTLLTIAAALIAAASCGRQPPAPSNSSEAEIRLHLDRWAGAFHDRDIDRIMAVYASGADLTAYDIAPPLEYTGSDAYRGSYENFLALFDGPIQVEFRDLRIVAGTDVAFIHTLEHMSGPMTGGEQFDLWMRVTSGLRKINGEWRIEHDHVSIPTDFQTGKSVMDLVPPTKSVTPP